MIQTVDNYFSFDRDTKDYYFKFEKAKRYEKNIIGDKLNITLHDYQVKTKNNIVFSFLCDEEKKELKNSDDELIISIQKSGDNYTAQTGNYIGRFVWDTLEIDIKSRFGIMFLERMLNFANDVYFDDVNVSGDTVNVELDISKFIIYYMFVQTLEKAFLLGLPKAYKSVHHHDMKLKGKIDINRFINNDIPFYGKISSVSREQKETQEIIDVLYKAASIVEKSSFSTKNISHIKIHLKQHKSNKYVSNETISKALKSRSLKNPIFSPYKQVLEYAKFIINSSNLEEKKDEKYRTFGFLVDVSELFEIYLVKLLRLKMPDWEIIHEEKLEVYEDNFYSRHMYPDIVMKKDGKVMIFDAKYKRMLFRGKDNHGMGDLDRSDFFQIHTYMSYYEKHEYDVVAGGLLYPLEKKFDIKEAHSINWFGGENTRFIVDGIDLSGIDNDVDEQLNEEEKSQKRMDNIVKAENDFIMRIESLIKEHDDGES